MEESSSKPIFHTQLAHGSPTGLVSGFTNVAGLYKKIAECYDLEAGDIMFCTVNTHKVDMDCLLGGTIGLEDFIFAHLKGQSKEFTFTKPDAIGLTVTDNSAGKALIKAITEGSLADRMPRLQVGDCLETINGESMLGLKHYEVAAKLKGVAVGSPMVLQLVEPRKSSCGVRHAQARLRFRYNAREQLEENTPVNLEDAPVSQEPDEPNKDNADNGADPPDAPEVGRLTELLEFLASCITEKESELECPVCLEVVAPLPHITSAGTFVKIFVQIFVITNICKYLQKYLGGNHKYVHKYLHKYLHKHVHKHLQKY